MFNFFFSEVWFQIPDFGIEFKRQWSTQENDVKGNTIQSLKEEKKKAEEKLGTIFTSLTTKNRRQLRVMGET